MTTYQTIRRRGLRKSANLPYAIKNSSQTSTKKATKTADLEQEGNDEENEDGTALTTTEQQYLVSPLPQIFGRAICDEAHYMKNVHSRTA